MLRLHSYDFYFSSLQKNQPRVGDCLQGTPPWRGLPLGRARAHEPCSGLSCRKAALILFLTVGFVCCYPRKRWQ